MLISLYLFNCIALVSLLVYINSLRSLSDRSLKRYVSCHLATKARADLQIGTFDYTQLGFQFLDFQLKSFVDPKPVELGESAIYQKFCLNKLV